MLLISFAITASSQIDCAKAPRDCERVILTAGNHIENLELEAKSAKDSRDNALALAEQQKLRADTEQKRADTLERANTTLEKAFDSQKEATKTVFELVALKDKEIAFQTARANEFEQKYKSEKKKTLVARIAGGVLGAILFGVLK